MKKISMKFVLSMIIFVIFLVVILIIGINSGDFLLKKSRAEIDVDKVYEREYLVDNCECIERNIYSCAFEGYEYKEGACRNNDTFTNAVRLCSKFSCSGQIVKVNETFWENE